MSSPTEVEHILSPAPQDIPMADTPSKKLKEGPRPRKSNPKDVELSVFDILNIFRRRWFLSRTNLLTNVISAQKAEDGKISWVEFTPQFHSHLVKCAVALVPHPVHKVKKVMFGYILELLNGEGHMAFFELQKGGRKANNAQKEKRRLARKRSRAAKRERDREAAKVAKQPPPQVPQIQSGAREKGGSQQSGLTSHDCSNDGHAASPPTPHAPTAPSNSNAAPVVTEGSQARIPGGRVIRNIHTGERRKVFSEEEFGPLRRTGHWRLVD
ncbi:hypothetical protein BGY98DRAFT_1191560 [Russula aff. rugulosa BPL654]|nr:hypothetical protein BGY98DRAFT_1191560 [Russula aff. rugulosa BPL654]